MAVIIQAARQFAYAVARLMAKGEGALEASMVKAYVCKAAEWVTREAMQIHGGMGYAEEYAVSRYFVDARVLSIFEGADETLCLKVIARRLVEQRPRGSAPDGTRRRAAGGVPRRLVLGAGGRWPTPTTSSTAARRPSPPGPGPGGGWRTCSSPGARPGIDTHAPGRGRARLRMAEQRASAAIVGVDDVEFLDHPDGDAASTAWSCARDIAAAIRRHRPEVVVTVNHRETYGGRYLNMADHRVTGQATIDAVRDAANRWVFTDLADAGLEPWGGVRHLAVIASPDADPRGRRDRARFDLGVASLRAHAAYLAGIGDPDPEAFLRGAAERAAARFGGRLAVSAFELAAGSDAVAARGAAVRRRGASSLAAATAVCGPLATDPCSMVAKSAGL